MDTLRLVEVTGDGDLLLMTGDGRRYSLTVDEELRSAVRRARALPEAVPASGRPGPREVQARIRAGADAEQVAAETGLDEDYVRRFEGPVLAERAHVADVARVTPVDRGGDAALTLEHVVSELLESEGHDVLRLRWDSRRVEGAQWQVVVRTAAGEPALEATWRFDTSTRAIEPVDLEAERLTGADRRRRLSAVRDTVFDVERPTGKPPRGGTVELLDALARQRGRRGPAAEAPSPERPVGRPTVVAGASAPPADATEEPAPEASAEPAQDGSGPTAVGAGATMPDPELALDVDPVPAEAAADDAAALGRTGDEARSRRPAGLRVIATRPETEDELTSGISIEPDLLSQLDLDVPATVPARGREAADGTSGSSRSSAAAHGNPSPNAARTGANGSPDPGVRPVGTQPRRTQGHDDAGDRRSRRRRAAVPSWDEIVFGTKRDES